jgi:hypothetical protein
MSHLSNESLWSVARESPSVDDQAHLAMCEQCRAELDNVKFAQGLLAEPPAPMPVLPEMSARRIGAVLRHAAEKQAERRASSWWPFKLSPAWLMAPLAAAALAFVAYGLQLPATHEGGPAPVVAKNEVPTQVESPVVVPAPVAPSPAAPAKKIVAAVTSARNARLGSSATLKKSQQLEEGSTVATSKGGVLWMKLPDGSRAGLTGASQVQLSKLEEKAVTLDVTQGSLVVVARHDTSRELRVRAGDLEVIDVGTRFLVSKDDKRTLVAVEEGEVEVDAPGRRVAVHAGQAVEWRGGKLTQEAWAPTADEPKPAPPPPSKTAQVEEDTPPIAPLPGAEGKRVAPPVAEEAVAPAPAPATEPPASSPEEWDSPANLKTAAANAPPPPPVPAAEPEVPQQAAMAVPVPAVVPAVPANPSNPTPEGGDDATDESFLQRLEHKLKRVANGIVSVTRSRDDRAGDITRLSADGRMCSEAISRADAWLAETVAHGESFNLRKSVLRAKLHCLQYQGRTGDAAQVQRQLEKL